MSGCSVVPSEAVREHLREGGETSALERGVRRVVNRSIEPSPMTVGHFGHVLDAADRQWTER